ncbi:MAG: hydroxyacid dehydrogenase [Acetobacteraceae bacterium]|nr:hydroxyacid dehydrogenase [Acetobacteraceae bacterium]
MPHVLVLKPIHPDAIALLEASGCTVEVLHDLSWPAMAEALPRAEAIIVRLHPIGEREVAAAPRLRVVARHGAGHDTVDEAALTRRGVLLTVTPFANSDSVAEHTILLMLACARHLPENHARVVSGRWGAEAPRIGVEIGTRTLLVIGFGRSGQRVARIARGFGTRVLVHDRAEKAPAIEAAGCTPAPDLWAALPEADIVSLHCPATEATRGMVNARFLAAMKPGAMLVNTARGSLLDEGAVAAALHAGRLAGAGLDVFSEEPVPPSNPLLSAPNVVLTPHVAAGSAEAMRNMAMHAAEAVLSVFAGRPDPAVVVNRGLLVRPRA